MKHLEDLEQQEEYETRVCFFRTVFDAYDVNFTNEMNYEFEGTQKDYDRLIEPYNWMVIRVEKSTEKPALWRVSERMEACRDIEEEKRRANFAGTYRKEQVQRQANYKYLKSGY